MGQREHLPLVVSMGEPAGIGPDIILSCFLERESLALPHFYVVGDVQLLKERAGLLNLPVDIQLISDANETHAGAPSINQIFSHSLPVLQAAPLEKIQVGHISSLSGRFVIEAIRRSVEEISSGRASGLVTAPIHKAALYEAGFKFPGHTEYLASLSGSVFNKSVRPVMMLASDELRVVPVTIHIRFDEVTTLLTSQLIIETIEIVDKDLKTRFGIDQPRIIVTGLNPHAGEDGTLGREEIEIIEPAITDLKSKGLDVAGPFSADTCFHPRARQNYDVAVAMYHDQALIPIKTISFDEGVNVTLGLPFIRTSPDHGTAVDIAGSGQAKNDSFVAALKLAADMAARQSAS